MMIRNRRESKQTVIVVLDGTKVSTEKTGISPLRNAMQEYVVNQDDEILVLTLLYLESLCGAAGCSCGDDDPCNQLCEGDSYIKFLHQNISQRKEVYMKIFRPFYDRCKRNGVKFQVKIAAGFRPKDIIVEEANNAKATWIVIDRCFVRDLTFRLSGTECNISVVGDEEELEEKAHNHFLSNDGLHQGSFLLEIAQNPKSTGVMEGSVTLEKPCPPFLASKSGESQVKTSCEPCQECEQLRHVEPQPPKKETVLHENIYAPRKFSQANVMLGLPLELSWEVIVEITSGFSTKAGTARNKNCMAYVGYLNDQQNELALVKRFSGDCGRLILEAEKKAALCMSHRNILGLIGYHQSENVTVLVFPYFREVTLDKYICDSRENQLKLTFQKKMKIAIGVAEGLRYMHEECPSGPVVHGDLQPSNLLLRHYLQPLITGFAAATWLHLAQPSTINSMCLLRDSLPDESMALVKSDVFQFGVLLLRLFCGKSAQEDDKSLVNRARPLILQRKFHELIEEDSDKPDVIGIYRVMAAATACTRTNPITRPHMSEVISILEGQSFCTMESSPSDSSF